jgi:hypothetical protein
MYGLLKIRFYYGEGLSPTTSVTPTNSCSISYSTFNNHPVIDDP